MIPPKSYEIINRYRRTHPVNVDALAMELGIPVKREQLDQGISGKLVRGDDDSLEIVVNSRHTKTRQRFTIAHEIGHAVLHGHLIGNGITDNAAYRAVGTTGNSNIGQAEETEANKFASTLLMPAEAIIELQNQELTPEQMAQALGVSPAALEVRLSSARPVRR